MSTKNQLVNWDWNIGQDQIDINDLKQWLKVHCKKWMFQLELGEKTKRLHWQGRFALKERKYKNVLYNQLLKGTKCATMEISPTVTSNKDDWKVGNYISKEKTRVEGPWLSWIKIPRQYDHGDLRDWQKKVYKSFSVYNNREINVLYCPEGNIGKSYLCGWTACRGYAKKIPPVQDFKDILQIVYAIDEAPCYLFDIPRALDTGKIKQMYAAIEAIKDGHVYDLRYSYKEKWIDSPVIWVFTNKAPEKGWLSNDRWKCWKVENKQLIKLKFDSTGTLTKS